MKRFVGAASGVILLFCTLACDPQAPVDQSELGKKSATLTSVEVAAAKALASDEKLVHSVAKHFPVTKQTVYLLSGRKADSDRVRKVAVRANGTEVDLIALKAAEKKAHRAKYGAVNQRLANKLGGQGAKTVPLHVVYDAPPLPPTPIGGSAAEWAKYDATIRSLFKNAPSKAVVKQAILEAGGKIKSDAEMAPVLRIEMRADKVLASQLRHHKHILGFKDTDRRGNSVSHAATSTQDLNLSAGFYSSGYYGSQVRVGIIETNTSGFLPFFPYWAAHAGIPTHPYFHFGAVHHINQPLTCSSQADCDIYSWPEDDEYRCYNGVCANHHATQVAGMVGHIQPTSQHRGAPNVQLYYGNGYYTHSHEEQLDWLTSTNNVWILNESYGGYGCGNDSWYRDHDIIAYKHFQGLTVFKTTGNDTHSCEAGCGNYADVCVSGYHRSAYWFTMYDKSSTKNRSDCNGISQGCDRELPHVIGHGQDVQSTSGVPTYLIGNTSGTSFASPAIAGMAALMTDRWSGTFYRIPTATKAALMASGDIDVDQPWPSTRTYSNYDGPDERDGAGIPDANRVNDMASNGRVVSSFLTQQSFNSYNELKALTVCAWPNEKIRAVAAWTSCPLIPYDTDYLHADIDLKIRYSSTGVEVASSSSYDQEYEITEATNTGIFLVCYDIVLRHFTWDSCSAIQDDGTIASVAVDIR